jgi:diguanylate cyclase (GGDEF)-like protein
VVSRLQALAHDRSQRWVELHASPYRELDGHLNGIVGSFRAVATRIPMGQRSGDMAARIGGDERMMMLQGVRSLGDVLTIAEKLRRAVAEPIPTSGGFLSITLSIGVTMVEPGESSDEIMSRADRAMYRAKQTGRNQVLAFSEQSDGVEDRSVSWQPVL